jgi:hypothetical protein
MTTSLTAIGAVSEYRTDFAVRGSDADTAVQMTAVFPDTVTARTSATVLDAWQQSCGAHATTDLGYRRVRVGPVGDVATSVGVGHAWPLTYRSTTGSVPQDWSQAEGYVTDNDTMTYLVIRRSAGQTGPPPPIDDALAVAGDFLVSSR